MMFMEKYLICLHDEFSNIDNIKEIHIAARTAHRVYSTIISHIKNPQDVFYSLTHYLHDKSLNEALEEYFCYCIAYVESNLWNDFTSPNPRVRRLARSIDTFLLYYLDINFSKNQKLVVKDMPDPITIDLTILQKRLQEYSAEPFVTSMELGIDIMQFCEDLDRFFLKKIEDIFDNELIFDTEEIDILKQELVDSVGPLCEKTDKIFDEFAISLFYQIP